MRVFLCEFVTSGGVRDKPLPSDILPEALLIRDSLRMDLEAVPGVTVTLAYDDRLEPPGDICTPVREGDDPWAVWAGLARDAQVAWPVAPETAELLRKLVRKLAEQSVHVIASAPDVLAITSSKRATARRLEAAGLPFIPTYAPDEIPPTLSGPLLTKPDCGSGCSETVVWTQRSTMLARPGFVVQPYLDGTPASLSLLVRPDGVTLLAANLQHVERRPEGLCLTGLTVGAVPDPDGRLKALAEQVVAAFPGLSGIVGVDLLLTAEGPVVVEINARPTTAYAGLHRALGVNPAAFLPELIREGCPPKVPHLPRPTPIEIRLR